MELTESAALESRYCQFEFDGGSGNLGQRNQNDTDTRTKITHIELFGNGIIGTVVSLAYGTWQGQPAALLVLLFSLRGRENGYLRVRRAQISITFRSRTPGDSYPVVRLIQPSSKRVPDSGAAGTPNGAPDVRASSPFAPWTQGPFAIKASPWSEKSQSELHQVLMELALPRGSPPNICESIPVATVLTFSSPFVAFVKAEADLPAPIRKLRAFPWSKDDPVLFDGITPKGRGVASTDFSRLGDSGLEEFMMDCLGPLSTRDRVPISSTAGSYTSTEGRINKPLASKPSRQVYRVHDAVARLIRTGCRYPHQSLFDASPSGRECGSRILWLPAQGSSASKGAADNDPVKEKDVDLHFDTDFHGFTQIGMNLDAHLSANVDIIAIHGLGGHAFGSFKQRGGHYMWLQETLESDLVKIREFGQHIRPRILIYGYDARVDKSQTFQSMEDLAIELRMQLQGIRQRHPTRPLIFIGHSLGGLLIKELLIQCAEPEANATESAILEATIGALFFGVPNKGMDVTALLSIIGSQPNSEFLTSLGVGSPVLAKQAELFPRSFRSDQAIIYSFYETCLSNTAERVCCSPPPI
ncbi:Protein SERAC1 [Fusarium odoratissimum]|uniref:Protein SERAC1 n=1 Tax=Fusarium oxysporum f. sp. cubense (strain race 4) TaxID=2502994 RepID=N1SB33_FUSC4|nr:Protein SERAC1 [Fusarium odoratissimum]